MEQKILNELNRTIRSIEKQEKAYKEMEEKYRLMGSQFNFMVNHVIGVREGLNIAKNFIMNDIARVKREQDWIMVTFKEDN